MSVPWVSSRLKPCTVRCLRCSVTLSTNTPGTPFNRSARNQKITFSRFSPGKSPRLLFSVRVSVWLPSTPQTETVAYWDSAAIHWAMCSEKRMQLSITPQRSFISWLLRSMPSRLSPQRSS